MEDLTRKLLLTDIQRLMAEDNIDAAAALMASIVQRYPDHPDVQRLDAAVRARRAAPHAVWAPGDPPLRPQRRYANTDDDGSKPPNPPRGLSLGRTRDDIAAAILLWGIPVFVGYRLITAMQGDGISPYTIVGMGVGCGLGVITTHAVSRAREDDGVLGDAYLPAAPPSASWVHSRSLRINAALLGTVTAPLYRLVLPPPALDLFLAFVSGWLSVVCGIVAVMYAVGVASRMGDGRHPTD